MQILWQDLRYGVRMLQRSPGFTVVAVLTLALGIGANTSIFSMINAVLLKSLPVRDPEQLVVLDASFGKREHASFSHPLFQDLRDRSQVFQGVFAYSGVTLNLSTNDQTERVSGALVSGNFFSVLGVKPYLGRVFSEEDDRVPGAHSVAVLSHDFWMRRFASDPTLIGKTIHLSGYPFTVVGISPAGFFGVEVGSSPAVWVPMMMQAEVSRKPSRLHTRDGFWVNVMARLKPGVSEQQAQAASDILSQQINQEAPPGRLRSFLLSQHIRVQPASKGLSSLRRQFQQPLIILMGVVGLVLLIACANVANLLLARATGRQKEIAVRLALGAGRFRLVRQLLTESLLLSLAGALLGLILASWTTDILMSFMPQARFALEPGSDFRVLAFNLCIAVLTGLLFGLAPALQATRSDLTPALKTEIPTLTNVGSRFQFRKTLVVSQVALSLLLLIGAGLFVRTLQNLKGVDLGFNADRVLLLSMNPALNGYSPNRVTDFYGQLLDRVKNLPGVQSASFADMPLFGGLSIDRVSVEGFQAQPGKDMSVRVKRVEPGYFETMGISILAGRDFGAQDVQGAGKVAIINEALARDFFGNESPIGRRVGVGSKNPDREIIGLIKDTKYWTLKERAPSTVYVPLAQWGPGAAALTLHVRTAGDPKSLVSAIRHEVRTLDKDLPLYDVRTFTELVAESISQERLIATLSSFFGLLALLLASIGLYGVMAYAVARRTREIGVRMALGASRGNVLWLVLRETLILVTIGIALGLPAAFALSRFVAGRLFALTPNDPVTILFATAVLATVAVFAGYLPARRATKVDPMVALRYE